MKALYATRFGGADVMRLGQLRDPQPGSGEVLVRVMASSVNPVDWKLRQGQRKLLIARRFPKVFGADFSGVVEGAEGKVSTSLLSEVPCAGTVPSSAEPRGHTPS